MASRDYRASLFPEIRAGGFSRFDGSLEFYSRVNALLEDADGEATVVDFGAGRGRFLENPSAYIRHLRDLRTRCSTVIGVDVDDAVRENSSLDQAIVIEPGSAIPLADGSVDLILSDFTFEHIADPATVTPELDRILRPGGWLCARTPHKWGYIGLGARLVPNVYHNRVLRKIAPRAERDVFPTTYQLNTRRAIRQWFPEASYIDCSYGWAGEPAYVGGSTLVARGVQVGALVTPSRLQPRLFIFLQKRTSGELPAHA